MSIGIRFVILENTNNGSDKFWANLQIERIVAGQATRCISITHWGKRKTVGQFKVEEKSVMGDSTVARKKIAEGYKKISDGHIASATNETAAVALERFFDNLQANGFKKTKVDQYVSVMQGASLGATHAKVLEDFKNNVAPLILGAAQAQPPPAPKASPVVEVIDRFKECSQWGTF